MERKNSVVLCRKRRTILLVRNPRGKKRNCRRTDSCCLFESLFQWLHQYFVFFGVISHIQKYYAYISIKNNVPRTSHSPYFSKSSTIRSTVSSFRLEFEVQLLRCSVWNALKFRSMAIRLVVPRIIVVDRITSSFVVVCSLCSK